MATRGGRDNRNRRFEYGKSAGARADGEECSKDREGGVSSQGTSRGRSFTLLAGAQLGIAWHEVTANQSSTIDPWDGIHPWI